MDVYFLGMTFSIESVNRSLIDLPVLSHIGGGWGHVFLKPLTGHVPNLLIPINDKDYLEIILEQFRVTLVASRKVFYIYHSIISMK